MPSPGRPLRLPFALLALVLPAAVAHAEGRFVAPALGASFEAGASVRVAWELPKATRQPFEEMELLLSLDGGRTFPIRVTRDLGAGTRLVAVRMPALPAHDARLALRAGDGEGPGAEEILLVSDSFSIVVAPDAPLEPMERVDGEWRTREALDGSGATPPPQSNSLSQDSGWVGSLPAMPPAASPRSAVALTSDSFDRARSEEPARPLSPAVPPALSRSPAAAPLRL